MSRIKFSEEEINRLMYQYDKMHVSLNGANEITDEMIDEYKRQGFVSSNNLLNDDEVKNSIDAIM